MASAVTDVLGAKLLSGAPVSWSAVERAAPPIRRESRGGACGTNCAGVRTFVGSRSASVDTTMDNFGADCNWEGWPSHQSFAVNMHNVAVRASHAKRPATVRPPRNRHVTTPRDRHATGT